MSEQTHSQGDQNESPDLTEPQTAQDEAGGTSSKKRPCEEDEQQQFEFSNSANKFFLPCLKDTGDDWKLPDELEQHSLTRDVMHTSKKKI